jgi:hypothetical protein
MYKADAEQRDQNRFPGDHGQVHSRTGVQLTGPRWQPHWWNTRPAPVLNWLERLERGMPLPRPLRR